MLSRTAPELHQLHFMVMNDSSGISAQAIQGEVAHQWEDVALSLHFKDYAILKHTSTVLLMRRPNVPYSQDQRETQELRGRLVLREREESMAHRATQGSKVRKERREMWGDKDLQERGETKVTWDLEVQWERRERGETLIQ